MQKVGWFHLRARSPSTFSSIASELNVPCEQFSSIAIEPNIVHLADGLKKYDSILPNNRDKVGHVVFFFFYRLNMTSLLTEP